MTPEEIQKNGCIDLKNTSYNLINVSFLCLTKYNNLYIASYSQKVAPTTPPLQIRPIWLVPFKTISYSIFLTK